MPRTPTFTAQLTPAEKAACVTAAAKIGCTRHGRGQKTERGSIQRMLEEISAGEVLVMFHQHDEPDEMIRTAARLREISAAMHPHDDAGIAITALAAAFENAARLKEASDTPPAE